MIVNLALISAICLALAFSGWEPDNLSTSSLICDWNKAQNRSGQSLGIENANRCDICNGIDYSGYPRDYIQETGGMDELENPLFDTENPVITCDMERPWVTLMNPEDDDEDGIADNVDDVEDENVDDVDGGIDDNVDVGIDDNVDGVDDDNLDDGIDDNVDGVDDDNLDDGIDDNVDGVDDDNLDDGIDDNVDGVYDDNVDVGIDDNVDDADDDNVDDADDDNVDDADDDNVDVGIDDNVDGVYDDNVDVGIDDNVDDADDDNVDDADDGIGNNDDAHIDTEKRLETQIFDEQMISRIDKTAIFRTKTKLTGGKHIILLRFTVPLLIICIYIRERLKNPDDMDEMEIVTGDIKEEHQSSKLCGGQGDINQTKRGKQRAMTVPETPGRQQRRRGRHRRRLRLAVDTGKQAPKQKVEIPS